MASEYIKELSNENFEQAIGCKDRPILVDFWASWCGPCRAIAPILEEIAAENIGKMNICKLNVDENNDIAMRYKVMSIPTMIVFKDGKPIDKIVGLRPKNEILDVLTKYI